MHIQSLQILFRKDNFTSNIIKKNDEKWDTNYEKMFFFKYILLKIISTCKIIFLLNI